MLADRFNNDGDFGVLEPRFPYGTVIALITSAARRRKRKQRGDNR